MQLIFNEQEILERLRNDDDRALDAIFHQYYDMLLSTAWRIVREEDAAKDLAQDVLAEIWIRRHKLNIQSTLGGYLRRATTNRSLDYLEKQKRMVFTGDEDARENENPVDDVPEYAGDTLQLEQKLQQAIDNLPEKCRIVFVMNRFEAMSYRSIAEQLQISVKTVEAQVSKALRILRAVAQEHQSLAWVLYFFLNNLDQT
jgi:RNA polymerase sigma-70 factor (ECF subfamily)